MPAQFTPAPVVTPLAGTSPVPPAWVGYFGQFDQVPMGALLGRGALGLGPLNWITLGSGVALTGTVLSATGLGGTVVGPAAAVDGTLAIFDGITGKLLKDSSVTLVAASPFTLTLTGSPTLADWFNQSVKTTASPAFAGLTVNGFAFTVNGAPTLNDWFDQSVKVAATPRFAQLGLNAAVSATAVLTIGGSLSGSSVVGGHIVPSLSPAANTSAAMLSLGGTIVEAGSGNHPLFAGVSVVPPTVTAGAGDVVNAASVYIQDAMTVSVSGASYALWVAAGLTRVASLLVDGTATVTTLSGDANIPRKNAINTFSANQFVDAVLDADGFAVNGTPGSDAFGLQVALTSGGTLMGFDLIKGLACNVVVTP